MRHPRLRHVFTSGSLHQMAVIRRDGVIRHAREFGTARGIPFWSDVSSARDYQARRTGYPLVVLEIPRLSIDVSRLTPHDLEQLAPSRAWLYPDPVLLESVRWHIIRQEIQAWQPQESPVPRGLIQIPTGVS